jgi:hypothetical protein
MITYVVMPRHFPSIHVSVNFEKCTGYTDPVRVHPY